MRNALRFPLLPVLLLVSACSGEETPTISVGLGNPLEPAAGVPDTQPVEAAFHDEESALVLRVTEPRFGDWDAILERRTLRVLVTRSRTAFFIAAGRGRGFELEMFREFEKAVNADLKGVDGPPFKVAFVPVENDQLLNALIAGNGDVAAALLTVTPERAAVVDFADPYLKDVSEVIVQSRDATHLTSLADLAGKQVFVAAGSSYVETLEALNVEFAEHGLEAIRIASPGRSLVQEDYLEMVSAGIFDYTICDRHFAEIWAEVLDDLVVRDDIPARVGGSLAWAIRKNSPGLQARLDEFVRDNKKGTMMGNVLFKRYFAQTKWVKNPITDVGAEVFGELRAPIQKYSEQYGFDWRLMAAQAYQESHLDPNARSYSGAIGLMQLLPATAKDMGFDDVTGVDDNLHAGIKYMAWLRDNYFSDETVPEASRVDFALAAYNAGIGRVRRWRREAPALGVDPDKWFGQVERIALEDVGIQPVQYVGNINKIAIAISLLIEEGEIEQAEIERVEREYGG